MSSWAIQSVSGTATTTLKFDFSNARNEVILAYIYGLGSFAFNMSGYDYVPGIALTLKVIGNPLNGASTQINLFMEGVGDDAADASITADVFVLALMGPSGASPAGVQFINATQPLSSGQQTTPSAVPVEPRYNFGVLQGFSLLFDNSSWSWPVGHGVGAGAVTSSPLAAPPNVGGLGMAVLTNTKPAVLTPSVSVGTLSLTAAAATGLGIGIVAQSGVWGTWQLPFVPSVHAMFIQSFGAAFEYDYDWPYPKQLSITTWRQGLTLYSQMSLVGQDSNNYPVSGLTFSSSYAFIALR